MVLRDCYQYEGFVVRSSVGVTWNTVASDSGQRTLETLIQFVKFVEMRSSDGVTWNGVRMASPLGTRHSPKHPISRELMRVGFLIQRSVIYLLVVVGLLPVKQQ